MRNRSLNRIRATARNLSLLVWIGGLLSAPMLMAHMSVLPHHAQDFEDLATGRDKRGIILLTTLVFISMLSALAAVVLRQVRQEKPAETLRDGQARLKGYLVHTAAAVRPALLNASADVMRLAVFHYAQQAKLPPPPLPQAGVSEHSFRLGTDTLTIRYDVTERTGPRLELEATSGNAGAEIRLGSRGEFAVSVFSTQAPSSRQALD